MKNRNGQIAIEYIVLIAILLLFFQAVIYPNVTFSENMINDIYSITQTKQSFEKLGDDISSFSSTPGYGKRLVYFYLPSSSRITGCSGGVDSNITYTINISSQTPKPNISACDRNTNICTFEKQIFISGANITCENIGPGFNGYLSIEKFANGEFNVSQAS